MSTKWTVDTLIETEFGLLHDNCEENLVLKQSVVSLLVPCRCSIEERQIMKVICVPRKRREKK